MPYLRGRSIVLSVLTLVVLATLTSARSYSSHDLPSPQKDPVACGRGNGKSAICDPDGYLSKSEADEIDGIINFINEGSHGFKKLPCRGSTGGPQIAIGIVGSMARGSGKKEDRAYKFAKDLHDRWGVGEASCQNGIVIFVAIKDRAMGFSTGRGLKKVFTDAMVPKIMALMRPKMREEEYGQALITAVTAIGNILSTGKAPEVYADDDSIGSGLFFILFGTIFGISRCFDLRKRRRYNRSKKLLEKIDKDRARASSNNYVITSCPICLEDFPGVKPNTTTSTTINGNQANTSTDAKNDALPTTVRVVQTGTRPNTASTSTEENDPVKTLPCGHKFHQSCIMSWISGPGNSNQLCPICRQPIVETDSTTVEQRTNNGRPSGWDVYDPEYSFRMQRANYFYPDYITWSMINSWERDRYRRDHSMANSSSFVAVDPVVIAAQARASGSGGSSFSFGGGSSGGGGGGGGGW